MTTAAVKRLPGRLRVNPQSYRYLLAAVMVTVVLTGWAVPQLGFIVPIVMLTAIVTSFRKGRHACGNLCPRGSFFDLLFFPLGGRRPIPALMRTPLFRWSLFAGLMLFMGLQISRDPGNVLHWGYVFWLSCAVTTAGGMLMGALWQPRTWCSVCPIGTLTASIGAGREPVQIAATCKACSLCEKSCPMELSIAAHRDSGTLPHGDCIKCGSCARVCPARAISLPS